MTFSPPNLLNLEVRSVHYIDTENTLSLHSLWSTFRNCADSLQEGKRLENLSWRIYSRETICCSPAGRLISSAAVRPPLTRRTSSDESVPSLSSSLDSTSSAEMEVKIERSGDLPQSKRTNSFESRKHLSPIDLENIVKSVTENSNLPLLPPPSVPTEVPEASKSEETPAPKNEPTNDSTQSLSSHMPNIHGLTLVPESSTSTFDTFVAGSECSQQSSIRPEESLAGSASTEVTGTSIVRGFSKEQISRSRRSTTQLAHAAQPILKLPPSIQTPHPISTSGPRAGKKAVFMLGTSEGEDSVSDHSNSWIHKQHSMGGPSNYRQSQTLRDEMQHHMPEDAIEDSEEDDDFEDDEDWEDETSEAAQPAVEEESRFPRVESMSNLSSRRSLITSMIHEKDRATALQNLASQSTPAIRRSRSHVSGPMMQVETYAQQPSRIQAQPMLIPQQLSQTEPAPLLSPRTNRRNMLSTELTGSLRKHLLWERQQRNPASKLLKNRQFRSESRLAEAVGRDNPHRPFLGDANKAGGEPSKAGAKPNLVRNDSSFFDNGALEYYDKGW